MVDQPSLLSRLQEIFPQFAQSELFVMVVLAAVAVAACLFIFLKRRT
jgi:hypothetical protein